MKPPVLTPKAVLEWSADGTTVTKRFVDLPAYRLLQTPDTACRNEARVNRLLLSRRPPVPSPALVQADLRDRSLTFEAVPGDPLGPKFPTDLTVADAEGLVALVGALGRYRPRRRWLRRLPVERRLQLHVDAGLLDGADAALVRSAASIDSARWTFAHGDVTARNVLRLADGRFVLIDWEWAGLHPPLYDVAFLSFSLALDDTARHRITATVPPGRRRSFLVSTVLIQLLHLNMWQDRGGEPTPFERAHADRHRVDLAELRRLTAATRTS